MDRSAYIKDLLTTFTPDDIPDEYVVRIEFYIGTTKFRVDPEDLEEWHNSRPSNARNVTYFFDLPKLRRRIEIEVDYIYALAMLNDL